MREIKFRAWDKNKKRMLPVSLIDFSEWWVSCEYGEGLHYGERNSFKNEETDRHILMQYTGREDIYEGDIVEAFKHNETRFVHEIVWRSGALWFGNWNWVEFQNIFRSVKVIGNKFEHPHLLAKEES